MTISVKRLRSDEWQRSRAMRLRALENVPDAFSSTLGDEIAMPEVKWRDRLDEPRSATFIASLCEQDAGIAVGATYDEAAGLFAMWVTPEARGRGVGDALIDAVADWAKTNGHDRLLLDVGDWNEPAIRLYDRNGFQRTGVISTLPPPRTHVTEHQRMLRLK